MKRDVGQRPPPPHPNPHPHPWPKINGFHTQGAMDEMLRYMREDKIWNVTEKLDGCNLSISTEGWIASRNCIIGERGMETLKFQGVSIEKDRLETLFENACRLKEHFKQNLFENADFELTLYGELILNGTGNSANDVYNYRKRNVNPGDYYCIGIGLILPENAELPSVFSKSIDTSNKEGKQYLIVPINTYLAMEFTDFDIKHVNIIETEKLSIILDDVTLVHNIQDRELEGYILSEVSSKGMIKLKPIGSIPDNIKHIEKIVQFNKLLTISS
jgi:hypothetical protein